ncbi:DUF4229 domain-containing protein [Microbacterium atlanticum]|uniref:DUF4229 domain-containing protein n=1 Tax=Microbacterium atlanticum TaxID=2782168 RepID=UPI001887F199|nr:DUF4229 domain-containing protein [Microbacterium atlanticum]
MKARSAIVYSVLRLLAFLVPFGILMLFPVMQTYYWLAAIFAALIGLSLSLLFLRKPLEDATSGFAARRAPERPEVSDEDAEDAAADAVAADASAAADTASAASEPNDPDAGR